MKGRRLFVRARCLFTLAFGLFAVISPVAGTAEPAPAWKISLSSFPTNFAPGSEGDLTTGPTYYIRFTNVGESDAVGPVVVTDTLPAGLTPIATDDCAAAGQTVTCTWHTLHPGQGHDFKFPVRVDALADPTTLSNEATISSPGAAPESASTTTTISADTAPFGLIPGAAGLGAVLSEADGSPVSAAGSHPSQLTVNLGVQTEPGKFLASPSGGGLRDLSVYLPPGLIVDPSATPARCTESQFESLSCPDDSVIGRANTILNSIGVPTTIADPLYNLVPPPGAAANFGFDPFATGLYVHLLGGVRASDQALFGRAEDLPSLYNRALYGIQLQFWGDPSSPSHDYARGLCASEGDATCPTPPQDTPAISLPTSCSSSLSVEAEVDSWEAPGELLSRSTPLTDLGGSPPEISTCDSASFDPSLSLQPTTDSADSPTGLDIALHLPQAIGLSHSATPHLEQVTVTLPEGLVVNPSGANGLATCSPEQVGVGPSTGVASGGPVHCPDAAKIGTVEVGSPLLAQYKDNRVKRDPQGHVVPEPISGSIYLATPHDNPFGSLFAIYVTLDEPERGIVVKLGGEVQADPRTGRLTISFANDPQLPFEYLELHFFGGAASTLRTPPVCGTKTTTSVLTPWSGSEAVSDSDSFQISDTPGGGPCPQSEAAAASSFSFGAGTSAPRAGAYSPLVLRFSREDGSQPIGAIDATLPPGLTGKLAGIADCPAASLAVAAAKSGDEEKSSPSCPASSELGTVGIGVGAGPAPFYTQGKAYLAPAYRGAPLSVAIIVPATVGPYDLGTVVVRAALFVDPETARVHIVSDPIPQILQGVPLDVRSVVMRIDRPAFVLNPTRCAPMQLTGATISPFGSAAPLISPFQVGGCPALAFEPKLALKLAGGVGRGASPALQAILTTPPGGANITRAAVTLPPAEFIDPAHIKAICSGAMSAASSCPAGSVFGQATVVTPLLDKPLTGPVYLRASSHVLPDLVADLNGQIHVVLVGRIDSVDGGIRETFEAVPDAPISKLVLEMWGGKRALFINSRNICRGVSRAVVLFDGQNGQAFDSSPRLQAKCPKRKPAHRRGRRR